MRFSRGVVKIPIKYITVLIIILSTAFLLYLHIVNHQRMRSQGQCRVFPPSAHPQNGNKYRNRTWQSHPVCSIEPTFTRFEDCPHCFRPNVQNLSKLLYQVQYSTSMFPRGPPNLFKPRNEIQQDFVTDYLITPDTVCVDTCPYLVAILLSVTDEVEQRNSIRATWGSIVKTRLWPSAQVNADVQILFVLAHQTGLSHINQITKHTPKKYVDKEHFPTVREWSRIRAEADRHGDILYLNMQDSYYNLTAKLLSSFKWVSDHCPKSKFILKVDTDTFVSMPLLLDLLIFNDERLEYSVIGKMFTHQRIVRRANKWAVDPQIYPPPLFPVYASGCAYVVSRTAMHVLVRAFPYFPAFHIEDAFTTGVLARMAGLQLIASGDNLFTHNIDYNWDRCEFIYYTRVAGTGVTMPFKLNNMWAGIVHDDGKCAQHNLLTMSCYCSRNETY